MWTILLRIWDRDFKATCFCWLHCTADSYVHDCGSAIRLCLPEKFFHFFFGTGGIGVQECEGTGSTTAKEEHALASICIIQILTTIVYFRNLIYFFLLLRSKTRGHHYFGNFNVCKTDCQDFVCLISVSLWRKDSKSKPLNPQVRAKVDNISTWSSSYSQYLPPSLPGEGQGSGQVKDWLGGGEWGFMRPVWRISFTLVRRSRGEHTTATS